MARLTENWLDDPVVVGVEERSAAPGTLVHRFLYVHGADEDRVAARIIQSYGRVVVFWKPSVTPTGLRSASPTST